MAIRLGRRRNDNEIGLTQNGARADCRLESRESRPAGGICSITRTPNRKCQNPLRMVEWWLCQRNLCNLSISRPIRVRRVNRVCQLILGLLIPTHRRVEDSAPALWMAQIPLVAGFGLAGFVNFTQPTCC